MPEAAEPSVFESVRYSGECRECGAAGLECWGVQALVDGRLRWDVESRCAACGDAVAACGGEVPAERREQLLAEHGPARLRVDTRGAAARVTVMRVLRAELGLDLPSAKAALHDVLAGAPTGTLPETERLARALRTAGVPATAVRP
ncbi:hypothetical protein [Streptomyces sp. NPDC101132]|uniref:hypothetical protein n=1 Tax=Streptomyces sp. NPDC101132 TaxID=3366110 RepID=UPI00382BB713